jgi:hypothetical protein
MKKLFAVAILLGVFFSAGLGVFLQPLLYTLTPLQRYYLGSYLASSWKAGKASATTEVRWVWKVKPETVVPPKRGAKPPSKFQYELATEDDLVPIPASDLLWKGDRLPFGMSQKAELEGWSAVVWLTPIHVNSAQLNGWLRHDFFEDEPAWRFFVQPVVLIASCVLLWLVFRSWRDGYRDRKPWQSSGQFWQERMLSSRARFQKRLEAGQAPQKLSAPSVRVIEAVRAESKTAPAKEVPAPIPQAVPVASKPPQPQPQSTLWDESKGIE